jgi:hypothetical protein
MALSPQTQFIQIPPRTVAAFEIAQFLSPIVHFSAVSLLVQPSLMPAVAPLWFSTAVSQYFFRDSNRILLFPAVLSLSLMRLWIVKIIHLRTTLLSGMGDRFQ